MALPGRIAEIAKGVVHNRNVAAHPQLEPGEICRESEIQIVQMESIESDFIEPDSISNSIRH